jgi:hypothetical protein
MSQNTSHAVMAQRREPADSLDYFPTPPWATRAVCEWIWGRTYEPFMANTAWEPACGEGHMARPMGEWFKEVFASDISDYGFGYYQDFLSPTSRTADWIITNPPFKLAQEFATKAIERSKSGAALLVRTAFLEGVTRHRELFTKLPPSHILQFTERVPMHKGRLVKDGSTATAYCWIVWKKGVSGGTRFEWIAPCRKRLERDEDYASNVA